MLRYFTIICLLCSLPALAQKPVIKGSPMSRIGDGNIIYRWQPATAAKQYKVVAKAYRNDNTKPVGELFLAKTTDTFVTMELEQYQQKLKQYQAEYKNKQKDCIGDKSCELRYETYLVAINKRKKSKPIMFKTLWQ